jgi:hypothetical protein
MRIHTKLTDDEIAEALATCQYNELIATGVRFAEYSAHGSRSHARAVDVQLGTGTGGKLPEGYATRYGTRQKTRRVRNGSGGRGASVNYATTLKFAATWEEWGELIAELFRRDPGAKIGYYTDVNDFHDKTDGAFA